MTDLTLAYLDLGRDGGTEIWLVPARQYNAIMAAFEWTEEDDKDPHFQDHSSPLDRAALVAGDCPVLSAHWGDQDVPKNEEELAAFLPRVVAAQRESVAEQIRDRWASSREEEEEEEL